PSTDEAISGWTPKDLLSELESSQDEQELKAKALELSEKLRSELSEASGKHAEMLESLIAGLEETAESGDLSVLKEKIGQMRPDSKRASEFSEAGAGLSLESLVSKFQTIKEAGSSKTPDGQNITDTDVSAETLISKIKSNLTDQLKALYTRARLQSSSVSLFG
ncbi:MAG: hypothetical protein LBB28_04980, partial [Synergistaceae bacterium]|nr:hypothetical protein [Synergistaceae bacterium]